VFRRKGLDEGKLALPSWFEACRTLGTATEDWGGAAKGGGALSSSAEVVARGSALPPPAFEAGGFGSMRGRWI